MAIRIYVNGLEDWRDELESHLQSQLASLGLPADLFPWVETDERLPARSIVLYLCDGCRQATAEEVASLEAHIRDGRVVIPVLDQLRGATDKLPPVLHDFNAYPVGLPPRSFGDLVDEILTRSWLARPHRKVFLSYKRPDSSAIAYQLRDQLGRRGYEVFLDETTMRPGTAVQREIHWWLNDADFVLLLASPNLESSKWVLEEIEFANVAEVGPLAVTWPDGKPPAIVDTLMEDQVHRLTAPLAGPAEAPAS